MSITAHLSRLRSSRRHPGRRVLLLALLAGLILAWCNGAFGRDLIAARAPVSPSGHSGNT